MIGLYVYYGSVLQELAGKGPRTMRWVVLIYQRYWNCKENVIVFTDGCRYTIHEVLRDGRSTGGDTMEPVYLSIRQEATGRRMRQLIREKGYSVREIQEAMGFENPQAVYKWLSGKSLPSLDNFLILSRVLHTSIEDILVVDGDIAVLWDMIKFKDRCWSAVECASMLAVSRYRKIPFIQFLYGADNLSSDQWEIRDLELYGLTNAEKYMLLAFECGLAM